MQLRRLVPDLCNELARRGGFSAVERDEVITRFNSAAENNRVQCTFSSLASSTEYSNPARGEYSFTFGLWWFPHRTVKDKLRHELAHHFVAVELKHRTGRDVFLEECTGRLSVEDALEIERHVREISDPTDPVRRAMCKLEWWSLVAAYWLSRHNVASAIIAAAVVGAGIAALVALW